jgi:hypothetical protein
MSDPKDELAERFENRRADTNESEESTSSSNMQNTGKINNSPNTGNTSNKPGPDRDDTATRHRQQVPMYLPDKKVDELNALYQQLDGRSKVAGEGAIEKHADFMETLVEFAIEHEDELAQRLGIGRE